ncbi:DUF502 domain-containing protein [Pontivivens insulae]|uniref:DUF502 domain-containing protein n=1 Tax=Pontivivens insulae TaxID=1639689 RepID=A0A2R8AAX2_9RHOB|nr:DUF502 domain-containing protein [Pontivivens insulae]RED13274.1 putative membrane protein [Pontivivens insulae]SPF29366.1 hypothetical protein POI8812_01674 [Pontivivens insulae]
MAPTNRPRRRRSRPPLFQRIRGYFLTGIVIVAPVGLTLWLIWTVINFIDAKVVPLVPQSYIDPSIPGFGVVIFLLFTALVGYLTKGMIGRSMLRYGENLIDRMPMVGSIYNGIKQIAETILSQSGSSFQKACLIEYPRRGIWAIAFVSTEAKGEVAQKLDEDPMISVFLPTTPNPTSGFLLFVPRSDVVMLDMDVEEAAKLVISAGLVVPPTPEERAAGVRVANRRGEPVRRKAS